MARHLPGGGGTARAGGRPEGAWGASLLPGEGLPCACARGRGGGAGEGRGGAWRACAVAGSRPPPHRAVSRPGAALGLPFCPGRGRRPTAWSRLRWLGWARGNGDGTGPDGTGPPAAWAGSPPSAPSGRESTPALFRPTPPASRCPFLSRPDHVQVAEEDRGGEQGEESARGGHVRPRHFQHAGRARPL